MNHLFKELMLFSLVFLWVLAFFFLGWLVAGCATEIEPVPFHGQLEHRATVHYLPPPDSLKESVLKAVPMLEQMGFTFEETFDRGADNLLAFEVQEDYTGLCDEHRTWLAYYWSNHIVMICNRALPVRVEVLAHEMGHSVGAPHISAEEGPALMNQEIPAGLTEFTELDAEAFLHRRVLEGSVFQ